MKYPRRSFLRLLVCCCGTLVFCGCKKKAVPASSNVDYYTCTMHPSVRSQDPNGKCPICGMDLVPVMKKGKMPAQTVGRNEQPNVFSVPVERQQQIGVTYAAVELRPLRRGIRAVGVVDYDMLRHWAFVARVDGYVQELFVTSPGQLVDKGQPLMSIYSPDLLTTERELVMLLRMRDDAGSEETRQTPESLITAARDRLRQWNMTDAQIAELEKSRVSTEYLTLRSPFRGVIQEIPAPQGASVKLGDHLVDLVDLTSVWVWADLYENELSLVRQGQKVLVRVKSFPKDIFEGEIAVINPFLDAASRTSKVRIDIPNPDFRLRPGMYADVELEIDGREGLTVPVSAIMPTGERNIVFVDKGGGKLEPRSVRLGGKFGEFYEVESGLSQGERVVASANFLIDAESRVQGALKDFGGTGPVGNQ